MAKEAHASMHSLANESPNASGIQNLIQTTLEDGKAEDLVIVDLKGKSALSDFMVIATGRSQRHVNALADQLLKKLREHQVRDVKIEGLSQCDWVLMDAGDVIVHLFRPEVREFYNLEKIWSVPTSTPKLVVG